MAPSTSCTTATSPTWIPARGWDGGVNNFYRLIYRGLTTFGAGPGAEGTKIVPDLATDHRQAVSDGAKTWTFTLKDGLFFEDGTPITSEAVKFGVERAWDPEAGIGSPYAKLLIDAPKDYKGPYVSGDLDTIETPDAKTIVFHLKKPFADFASALAQPNFVPFPKGTGRGSRLRHQADRVGTVQGGRATSRGASLKLVRNPQWKADDRHRPRGQAGRVGVDVRARRRDHRRAHARRAGRRRRRHRGHDPGGDRGPDPDPAAQGTHADRAHAAAPPTWA